MTADKMIYGSKNVPECEWKCEGKDSKFKLIINQMEILRVN